MIAKDILAFAGIAPPTAPERAVLARRNAAGTGSAVIGRSEPGG